MKDQSARESGTYRDSADPHPRCFGHPVHASNKLPYPKPIAAKCSSDLPKEGALGVYGLASALFPSKKRCQN
jgi:hypothetical protein